MLEHHDAVVGPRAAFTRIEDFRLDVNGVAVEYRLREADLVPAEIVYGRSDATINRNGIRMGTSELYSAVEALPEVADSLVVDLEYLGRPPYMPLFVVMRGDARLDDALEARITSAVRTALTPKHVPSAIFAIPEVPRTLSGKKLEVPIKRLLLGEPVQKVCNVDAVANPAALEWFVAFSQEPRVQA